MLERGETYIFKKDKKEYKKKYNFSPLIKGKFKDKKHTKKTKKRH